MTTNHLRLVSEPDFQPEKILGSEAFLATQYFTDISWDSSEADKFFDKIETPSGDKGHLMSDGVSRDELKVHLELLEEKSQRRADAVEAKIDALTVQVVGLVASVQTVSEETKADNKATRSSINGTIVATGLAMLAIILTIIISAVQIINSTQGTMTTALGNSIAAFSLGQANSSPKDIPPSEGAMKLDPATKKPLVFKGGKWVPLG